MLPDDAHDAIKAFTAERGLSLTAFVKSAIFSALQENHYDPDTGPANPEPLSERSGTNAPAQYENRD